MKYGRPIDCGDGTGVVRMTDVVTLQDPLPSWALDADAWLDTMFGNQKAGWVAAGAWFTAVPEGVQPGARHTGADFTAPAAYLNPDGSDGDGALPEPPIIEPPSEPDQ